MNKPLKKVAAALMGMGLLAGAGQAAADLNVLNLSYRTGPFAAPGIPLMDGMRDYMLMLNERDGGIGGSKINYIECETGYNTTKGVECYEKHKADNPHVIHPWSTGITLQLIPKVTADEIPMLTTAYGYSASAVGEMFPWIFNPPVTYWDGASMILKAISNGDVNSLKGKKVALLHLDHPYGKEPIPLLQKYAETAGFTLKTIPVGLKEMQNQSAQWLQVRRERPDFVVMWGWGAMNAGAINEAIKTRFDMNKFIGIWWSGHDGDLAPAGKKAAGYRTLSWNVPGEYPALADIKKHVVDKGNSKLTDPSTMQSNFYTRGVAISVLTVEAARAAQEKFGTAELDKEQMRWGLENVNISNERLKELGLEGLLPEITTTCNDHSGQHGAWVLKWDGEKFVKEGDMITPDKDMVRGMLEETAIKYAESNAPWPGRDKLGACE